MDAAALLEHARRVLAAQPFSVLIDARIESFSPGRVELQVPVTDKVRQQNGFVHGGVVSYAADNALTYAGGSVLALAAVTSEFKINYVRPAIGELLIARAEVVHAGRMQAVCRCDVFVRQGGEDKLCAVAQGTIARLSEPKPPKEDA
jgi:uncharacterized protein (TIGR00369 family)